MLRGTWCKHYLQSSERIVLGENCFAQRVNESSVVIRIEENDNVLTHSLAARNAKIKDFLAQILVKSPLWIQDYIVSYDSLLLVFNPLTTDFTVVINFLAGVGLSSNLNTKNDVQALAGKAHIIDVCYTINDENHPNDVNLVSQKTGLSRHEIMCLHQRAEYQVFAIGFMPNFAYLGELPEKLQIPRLDRPRQIVPAGAVAIADKQTAVYPSVSPGGWHIIGYTAFSFESGLGSAITPADVVTFNMIDEATYLSQQQKSRSQLPSLKASHRDASIIKGAPL